MSGKGSKGQVKGGALAGSSDEEPSTQAGPADQPTIDAILQRSVDQEEALRLLQDSQSVTNLQLKELRDDTNQQLASTNQRLDELKSSVSMLEAGISGIHLLLQQHLGVGPRQATEAPPTSSNPIGDQHHGGTAPPATGTATTAAPASPPSASQGDPTPTAEDTSAESPTTSPGHTTDNTGGVALPTDPPASDPGLQAAHRARAQVMADFANTPGGQDARQEAHRFAAGPSRASTSPPRRAHQSQRATPPPAPPPPPDSHSPPPAASASATTHTPSEVAHSHSSLPGLPTFFKRGDARFLHQMQHLSEAPLSGAAKQVSCSPLATAQPEEAQAALQLKLQAAQQYLLADDGRVLAGIPAIFSGLTQLLLLNGYAQPNTQASYLLSSELAEARTVRSQAQEDLRLRNIFARFRPDGMDSRWSDYILVSTERPWPMELSTAAPAAARVLEAWRQARDVEMLDAYSTLFDQLGSSLTAQTPSHFRAVLANLQTYRHSAAFTTQTDRALQDSAPTLDMRFTLDEFTDRLVDLTSGLGWFNLAPLLRDQLNSYRRGLLTAVVITKAALEPGQHVSLEKYFRGQVPIYAGVVEALIRNHYDKHKARIRQPDPPAASRSAFRKPDETDDDEWTAEPADAQVVTTRGPGPPAAPAFTCLVCKLPGHRACDCPVLMQPAVRIAITNAQVRASGSAQPAPSPASPSATIKCR